MTSKHAPVPFEPGKVHVLGPGDWTVGQGSGAIETLLGSCVCVTLWHPGTQVGAACHIVLPETTGRADQDDPRYAEAAMRHMLKAIRRRGADPKQCQAKVFGGGRMFDVGGPDIGQRNADAALRLLQQEGIPLSARCLGRDGYRRIRFDLSDGAVLQRFDRVRPIDDSEGAPA